MEVHPEVHLRKPFEAGPGNLFDKPRISVTDRVAEGDLADSEVCGFFNGSQDRPHCNSAFERASECRGKVDPEMDAPGTDFVPDFPEVGKRFLRRPADIVDVMGAADREEKNEVSEAAGDGVLNAP